MLATAGRSELTLIIRSSLSMMTVTGSTGNLGIEAAPDDGQTGEADGNDSIVYWFKWASDVTRRRAG